MGWGFRADVDLTIGEKFGHAGCTYMIFGSFLSLLAVVLGGLTTIAFKVGILPHLVFYLGYGVSALLTIPLWLGVALYCLGAALDGISKNRWAVALMNRRRQK